MVDKKDKLRIAEEHLNGFYSLKIEKRQLYNKVYKDYQKIR